jgi:hypothetical protein
MKKLLSLIFMLAIVGSAYAQNNFFPVNGNVGIGTSVPKAKLDIVGGIMMQSLLHNASARPPVNSSKIPGEIRTYSSTGESADDGLLRLSSGGGTNSNVISYIDISSYSTIPDMYMNIVFGTNGSEKMRINVSGNVGIGTANPTERLSVNGKIRAHEIKVETANWPDYVFAKDYRLPSLQETENHIKEKGHLPGIPSAAEVKANGIDLGEMNAKLLKKIEELTLYLIEQGKEIKELKNEVKILKEN